MDENIKDLLISLGVAGISLLFVKLLGIKSEDFLVAAVGMMAYLTYRNYEESL
jgi:hypothetical protein